MANLPSSTSRGSQGSNRNPAYYVPPARNPADAETATSAPAPKHMRAIDAFMQLPELPSHQRTPKSRAVDLLDLFPTHAITADAIPAASAPSGSTPRAIPRKALDVLGLFPTTPSNPVSRPIAKLPRRARPSDHVPMVIDIDLTTPERKKTNSEVLEITDSDDDDDEVQTETRPKSTDPHRSFVYNTNDIFATRQTIRTWPGSYFPETWIPSREELHSDQVDEDRALPAELCDASYPSFAISAGDMESLHRYLLARYKVDNLNDYLRLLALFRNIRAIESQNALSRWDELAQIALTIETARVAILQKLEDR